MKNNLPLKKIYTETIEWKNKRNQFNFSCMSISALTKSAEARVYGPSIVTKISLTQSNAIYPSGRHVTITSFNIDAFIFGILMDKDLMQTTNVLFEDSDINNPFIVKENDTYSDFHTSEFYLQIMKQKNINQENDFLVPIQLYLDETVLDSYGKLSLYPLVMTFMIFNRSTHNLSMSWRTLGYIPNFDAGFGSKKYSLDTKHNDFHYCLCYLLSSLEKLLSCSHGFDWIFVFKSYPKKYIKQTSSLL